MRIWLAATVREIDRRRAKGLCPVGERGGAITVRQSVSQSVDFTGRSETIALARNRLRPEPVSFPALSRSWSCQNMCCWAGQRSGKRNRPDLACINCNFTGIAYPPQPAEMVASRPGWNLTAQIEQPSQEPIACPYTQVSGIYRAFGRQKGAARGLNRYRTMGGDPEKRCAGRQGYHRHSSTSSTEGTHTHTHTRARFRPFHSAATPPRDICRWWQRRPSVVRQSPIPIVQKASRPCPVRSEVPAADGGELVSP